MYYKKVTCPFCKGEGCCNCDHEGKVPIGESFIFKTEESALNHDPEISYFDIKYNRANNLPDNYKPF